MFRRRTIRAASAILAVALLTACGSTDSGSSGSGTPNTEATLRMGWTTGSQTLDPHMAISEIVAFRFGLNMIYDRLFTVKSDATVEGMLVQNNSYSE
ncbi:MAG: hypothetical protein ABS976_16150, partial [Rhodococcus sp. (in: high G+C Gram-positive bacteria)]